MEFVVIAHDHKDEGALERRMAVREAHFEYAQEMFELGRWLSASTLLDDEGKMNGSVIFCDYPSENALKKEWLENEAYVVGNVWNEITIRKSKVAKH